MNQERRKKSGGQAIIMATLALLAMCGLMGLAVDLGWSFFVQKQAQAAADAAALGAVQEAMTRLRSGGGSVTGYTCASGGTGATQVDCQTTKIGCASVPATSNLNNGCQYARQNGFDWTTSRQDVTMQSNDGATVPPTAPGVTNIAYWVTARTVQTVPQLFSSVASNTQGTVSAVATAGIVGVIVPGSFYGMDRRGDCFTATANGNTYCGLDVLTGTGSGQLTCGSTGNANLCAPNGIILASNCDGTKVTGECSEAGKAGYAGDSSPGSGSAAGSSLTVMGPSGAVTGPWKNMSGGSLPVTNSTSPTTFADPTSPNAQPPLATSGSAMGSCGILHSGSNPAVISGTQTVGPYLYYSYSALDASNKPIPDGYPISVTGNVTFSSSGNCPTGAVSTPGLQTSNTFPTTIFYGGLQNSGTVNLIGGQYVMAGTRSSASGATVFSGSGTVQAADTSATSTGTMFIFTDGNYPGMNLPSSFATQNALMNQGTVDFKNASITMSGLQNSVNTGSNLPRAMNAYSGIAWWQDRRNSSVGYNEASGAAGCPDCTADDGSVVYCNVGCPLSTSTKLANLVAANHVTATSPGMTLDPGNGNINISGVFYQPRGAWMEFVHGTTGFSCGAGKNANGPCPLQVITGSLIEDQGDTGLLLSGLSNSLTTFKAALIQ
jgi:Flp pilus assembly protein TadG